MNSHSSPNPSRRGGHVSEAPNTSQAVSPAVIFVVFVAYYLASWVGSLVPDPLHVVRAFWPAGGLALGALLLAPVRSRPALLVALFLSGTSFQYLNYHSASMAIGYGIANLLERLTALWVLGRISNERIRLRRSVEVVGLLFVAVVANGVSAGVAATIAMWRLNADFGTTYVAWWIANGVSLFFVTSCILVFADVDWKRKGQINWRVTAEAAVFFCAFFCLAFFVLHGTGPYLFILTAILAFPALRFGRLAMVITLLILAGLSVTAAAAGRGPFTLGGVDYGTMLARSQIFVAVSAVAGLLLATTVYERREARLELSDSESKLRILSDNLPGAILYQLATSANDAREFLYISGAVEQVHGISAEAVLSDASLLHSQIHPDDVPVLRAAELRALETGGVFLQDARIIRPDGEERIVKFRSASRILPDGRQVWEGVETDITEQTRQSRERERLEQQLVQARKMEAIGTLAGGIAHDFNNILAAIIGYTDLSLEEALEHGEQREHLEQVLRAGRRGRELVAQILTFSRQQMPEKEPLEVRKAIDGFVKMLRATFPAGVEIVNYPAGQPLTIFADASQFDQVLLNLCTNAWHSFEGSSGRITIQVQSTIIDENRVARDPRFSVGPYVCISVADNGRGMDQDTLARVFEPFFTTKAPGQGTGLGMAVIHGIVTGHSGVIDVESLPHKGTTVYVYFPAITPTAPKDIEPVTEHAGSGDGERILYVDDEEALVSLMTRLLTRFGYRPVGFSRPSDALAALTQVPLQFDLVVTDYNMPEMTGLELAEKVFRLHPDLPVLLTSGFMSGDLQEKAEAIGIKAVIYKPSTAAEFSQAIQQFLNSQKGLS